MMEAIEKVRSAENAAEKIEKDAVINAQKIEEDSYIKAAEIIKTAEQKGEEEMNHRLSEAQADVEKINQGNATSTEQELDKLDKILAEKFDEAVKLVQTKLISD